MFLLIIRVRGLRYGAILADSSIRVVNSMILVTTAYYLHEMQLLWGKAPKIGTPNLNSRNPTVAASDRSCWSS